MWEFIFLYFFFFCHRVNFGTTSSEGRSEFKCHINSLFNCVCGLLSLRKTHPSISKYVFSFPAYNVTETMSKEHAMCFPLVGSAMLLSLFQFFMFLSKDLVNAVLTCYFFVLGIVALLYESFLFEFIWIVPFLFFFLLQFIFLSNTRAGLFVYDIFWGFFTSVMVSVAKSFDAPIKVST
ncbi:hypothetical protein GIB67_039550 [Kingdonia uniflora]|uniref:Uncharacterized protein n=1 Tax=Kingdonia uniflora TaxID=39325 RepID=A0A7J7LIU7_9MAGN|nr:hypothetical protein GIB67_039550 [Kingdonia uniflora]